jgi:serine/threonine-protein kinase
VLSQPDQEDFVKLLDFGIARQLHGDEANVTLVGTVIGTPAFMAPEQLTGAADAPSDVFALGATLYVMLSGRLPFEPRPGEHFTTRTGGPPALPPGLPPALDALVMRCLAPEPAQRPADGAALLAELDALGLPPWTLEEAKECWAAASATERATGGEAASKAGEASTTMGAAGEADTLPA